MNLKMNHKSLKELEKIQRNVVNISSNKKVIVTIMPIRNLSPNDVFSILEVNLATAYCYAKFYQDCGADGVHPTRNSRSTYGWIKKGEEFKHPTVRGRDGVNINGLLNVFKPTDVIVHIFNSINTQPTKELFQMAFEKNLDPPRILIIMDNVRYCHNKGLIEWMKGTRITPIYQPPYSPNLNLIERL